MREKLEMLSVPRMQDVSQIMNRSICVTSILLVEIVPCLTLGPPSVEAP